MKLTKFFNKRNIIILLFVLLIIIIILKNSGKENYVNETEDVVSTENPPISNIGVDIKGAVVNPGFYMLSEEARVNDLILLAGGFNNANELCVNLAHSLVDGQSIYIKSSDESCEDNKLININTASAEELDLIKGIGPTRAEDIINFRDINGPFQSIEDIKNVSGIGDSTFEKMKEQITI